MQRKPKQSHSTMTRFRSEVGMIKRRRTAKLTAAKVQVEFNAMIRRRDGRCMVNYGSCDAPEKDIQCSHFYSVKGNGGLRFYPYNAWGQCSRHHLIHHNTDSYMYAKWMEKHCPEELKWMESVRGKPVRYTQIVLREILDACKADDCERVRKIVRGLFV